MEGPSRRLRTSQERRGPIGSGFRQNGLGRILVASQGNPRSLKVEYSSCAFLQVEVIRIGNDFGKRGKVIEVLRRSNSVVVANAGFVKGVIFTPTGTTKEVLTEGPIHVSDVMLVCPKTK